MFEKELAYAEFIVREAIRDVPKLRADELTEGEMDAMKKIVLSKMLAEDAMIALGGMCGIEDVLPPKKARLGHGLAALGAGFMERLAQMMLRGLQRQEQAAPPPPAPMRRRSFLDPEPLTWHDDLFRYENWCEFWGLPSLRDNRR